MNGAQLTDPYLSIAAISHPRFHVRRLEGLPSLKGQSASVSLRVSGLDAGTTQLHSQRQMGASPWGNLPTLIGRFAVVSAVIAINVLCKTARGL